jgi:uncharacterized repeat protein (TIGR03803 family)/autotransporter-associated beta strand protein
MENQKGAMPGDRCNRNIAIPHLPAMAALMLAAAAAKPALAQSYTENILASFNYTDGWQPNEPDGLTLLNGTLYGTTSQGGANGLGEVFSVPVTGGTPNVMYSFTGGSDGEHPLAGLTLSTDGTTFYTTGGGVPSGSPGGAVLSIPVTGGSPSILYSFTSTGTATFGNRVGSGDLVLSGNTLYGTTIIGGPSNAGVVFSEPTSGGTPTVLYSFTGTGAGRAQPGPGVILSGNTLYGVAEGGGASNKGFVYSLPASGGTPTTLFSFNGTTGNLGYLPDAGLTLSHDGSTLYGGTALGGSTNDGVVFSEPVTGGTPPTTLVSFTGTGTSVAPGSAPGLGVYDKLLRIGSTLYGTTLDGGANNDGEVFSVPTTGGTPTVLYSFTGTGADGANPSGGLITDHIVNWNTNSGTWDSATSNWSGNLYGTTLVDGINGYGTVFEVSGPINYMDGDQVTFGSTLSANSTITVQAAGVAPASITFNNSSGFTYNFTGGAITGTGNVTVLAGTVILSNTNSYTGGTTVAGGTLIAAAPNAIPAYSSLNISSGATVIAANHGTGPNNNLLISSLTLASGGLIDLTNNDLVIRGGVFATAWGALAGAYNQGAWNGATGIISSTAATNTTHLTTLGVIINDTTANTGNASGTALYTSIDTTTPTVDGDILVKYTYYGDANLSGNVDGSDYSLIDNGYLNHLTGWYNGDFNYDGVVDGSDYTLIDNAFNSQGTAISAQLASPTAIATAQIAGNSAVPEPAAISLIGFSTLGLLRRRRRATGR